MSNPFGDPDEENSGEILEGFLCPICREDLKSLQFLTEHFERAHAEEQDALKSVFMDILSKAKRRILLNFDDSNELSRSFENNVSISGNGASGGGAAGNTVSSYEGSNTSNARSRINVYNFMDRQEVGVARDHLEYFQSVRNPRMERYASETNKLILRLHKLLKDMPTDLVQRKQHEKNIVSWLDGSSVKLCPSCAKSFHIARRQHHCRLCGSIMCHDCSQFLSIQTALELTRLTMPQTAAIKHLQPTAGTAATQPPAIRACDHCLWLLGTRQEMHESQTCRPPISQLYSEVQQLRKDVAPDIEMYLRIVASLYDGESIFTIADASSLRGKIGQIAESIDVRSKRIFALPCEQGSREEALKKAIRVACIQLIKERMLSLPPLPAEEEIRQIQERKRLETEQRIATERKMALDAYERYGLAASSGSHTHTMERVEGSSHAQGTDLRSLDNWSAPQLSADSMLQSDDPLIEQINIIKSYIRQARQEMNFDVVETLEMNLRELQREFYERQRASALARVQVNDSPTTPQANYKK